MELLKYEKTTQNTHWILKDNDEEWRTDVRKRRTESEKATYKKSKAYTP